MFMSLVLLIAIAYYTNWRDIRQAISHVQWWWWRPTTPRGRNGWSVFKECCGSVSNR